MGHVVVVAQVHGRCVGAPQVSCQQGLFVGGTVDLQRGGVTLPEILDGNAQAAAHVSHKGIAGCPVPRLCAYPGVVGVSPLGDGKALVVGLAQTIRAPRCPVAQQVAPFRVECRRLGYALACHLVEFKLRVVVKDSAARQGLDALGPHALVCRKCNVAIIKLFAHGNDEPHPKCADEVIVLVAVEDKRVNHLHLLAALIEIQAYGEGQPLATAACVVAVDAYRGAHLPLALNVCRVDNAAVVVELQAAGLFVVGLVLRGADEVALLGDSHAVEHKAVDEAIATWRDVGLQRPGVYHDTRRARRGGAA